MATVPSASCPGHLELDTVNRLNDLRAKDELPPLKNSFVLHLKATDWVRNSTAFSHWYYPQLKDIGQYVIAKRGGGDDLTKVDLTNWDPLDYWVSFRKGVPFYTGDANSSESVVAPKSGGAALEPLSDDNSFGHPRQGEYSPGRDYAYYEWTRTKWVGVGCGAYHRDQQGYSLFWLVAFFTDGPGGDDDDHSGGDSSDSTTLGDLTTSADLTSTVSASTETSPQHATCPEGYHWEED